MSRDYDKEQWQAEQAARDAYMSEQREKWAKQKERSARNAQRKLERLRRKLTESGELTEWEDEFSESVVERLDKFGSAFQDPEKGRPADALSFAQKRVMAALNKKAKTKKKVTDEEGETVRRSKPRSSFKSKKKPKFTPRVRQLDDELPQEAEPYIPQYQPDMNKPVAAKRPFLRVVE